MAITVSVMFSTALLPIWDVSEQKLENDKLNGFLKLTVSPSVRPSVCPSHPLTLTSLLLSLYTHSHPLTHSLTTLTHSPTHSNFTHSLTALTAHTHTDFYL